MYVLNVFTGHIMYVDVDSCYSRNTKPGNIEY